jgi:hypothetical protein
MVRDKLLTNCRCQTWKHVGVTWDRAAGEAKLYVDGLLAGTTAVTGHGYDLADTGSGTYQVGYNVANDGDHFHGYIRNMAIFKKALKGTEILEKATEDKWDKSSKDDGNEDFDI